MEVGWEFRRWRDGTVLSAEDLATSCERLYGEHTYTAHRADLLDCIKLAVPDTAVRLRKRLIEVVTSVDHPVLRFDDGHVVEADVVIGADGIHSTVRQSLATATPATYSGLCAFRALVPIERTPPFARRRAHTLWIGPGRHLVHYPISAGKYVNLVAFCPAGDYSVESWSATATLEEFLTEFEDWDPRLRHLIQSAGTPGRWALLDRPPLRCWTYGTVTLLGDAAHPMFPFYAQGAAQAIEDAATLAGCLADEPADPAHALRRYEKLRIPRTTKMQQVSRARSHINHLPDGPEQQARDKAFTNDDPLAASGWIYAHDPEAMAPPP
ncbi:hypothetical protein Vau01_118680 [Virgisporangium aurantiacum]|uniref:FAD-binding domain-containing protein n=2 Tax=Virgisporangium aurantiacum TaxID=175570 RepID=A0A8J3ZHQ7_9ACTN|nr:hypothetical protein Vau01_118680 [Virgisporangium aurantiacum]